MAERNDTSKPRKDRNPATAVPAAAALGTDDGLPSIYQNVLEAAIDAERTRLMQAHAVLRCLYEVLLYADDEDSLLHADVVKLATKLIDDSVSQLDWLLLEPLFDKARHQPGHKRSRPFEVRDLPVQRPLQLTREALEQRLRRMVQELQKRHEELSEPVSLGEHGSLSSLALLRSS